MEAHKAQFALSRELVQEIDALVGPDGRSAFLEEAAQAEVRRRQLLAFLRNPEPAWKDESHPELAGGTASWVRSLRGEWSDRSLSHISESRRLNILLDTTVLVDALRRRGGRPA